MAEPRKEQEILSDATHLPGALVPQPGPRQKKMIAGNAGNIKLVCRIYPQRLDSEKSSSRQTSQDRVLNQSLFSLHEIFQEIILQ